MENFDPQAVKIMLASLQRQRNSANDKIVDLETSLQLKDLSAKSLEEAYSEELTACTDTITSLREIHTKVVKDVEFLKYILTRVHDGLPEGMSLVKTDKTEIGFDLVATSSISEQTETLDTESNTSETEISEVAATAQVLESPGVPAVEVSSTEFSIPDDEIKEPESSFEDATIISQAQPKKGFFNKNQKQR